MEEKIVKEFYIPKEEYLEFSVETSKPLEVYKQHYSILFNLLQIKRSKHYVKDLRFDATDNSFYIKIDVDDVFDESSFFKTSFLIETIMQGSIPKEEKNILKIKLRAKLICEVKIADENKILFSIKKFFAGIYFNLFYEKILEERIKRLEEVIEKLKNEIIRVAT